MAMATKKALVAYATRYGSALEVAERVTTVLRDLGWSADVQPVEKVKDLSGYSAVLLGAPYYLGKMLRPVASEMFVGKYDPAVLRGVDKLLTKLKASPLYGVTAHDDRDWQALDGWARSLGAAMLVTE